MNLFKSFLWAIGACFLSATVAYAGEAELAIPDLEKGEFTIFGGTITAWNLLFYGSFVICGTLFISLYLAYQIKKLPAHKSMLDIAEIIFQTCKTYLIQQGKFLLMLFVLIAIAISYYMLGGSHGEEAGVEAAAAAANQMSPYVSLALVLFFSIVGMAG